jgi:phage terminase Nu1 subunit (DNA packaging protein)
MSDLQSRYANLQTRRRQTETELANARASKELAEETIRKVLAETGCADVEELEAKAAEAERLAAERIAEAERILS